MKIAIVHELLTMKGGAERVARIFADMFPDAPVFTLLYDQKKLGDWFPRERVRVSSLQSSRFRIPSFNHHYHLKHFPAAVEAWDFSDYDLVLSSSSAFVHGIITNGNPVHLCYVHSPARYLWDRTHEVTRTLHPLLRPFFRYRAHRLRIWDSEAADRPDALLAPSREVQRRIELYWRRESEIVSPPIDDFWTENRGADHAEERAEPYFLIASTLARYKRIDVAVRAANEAKVQLVIAGEGTDEKRLRKLAGPTVRFVGRKERQELRDLYANARATIFPGEEDFGLVPIESMACGTPVIAYGKGGALETVTEGKTGVFFEEESTLTELLKHWKKEQFDPPAMHEQARKFSRGAFEQTIREKIEEKLEIRNKK